MTAYFRMFFLWLCHKLVSMTFQWVSVMPLLEGFASFRSPFCRRSVNFPAVSQKKIRETASHACPLARNNPSFFVSVPFAAMSASLSYQHLMSSMPYAGMSFPSGNPLVSFTSTGFYFGRVSTGRCGRLNPSVPWVWKIQIKFYHNETCIDRPVCSVEVYSNLSFGCSFFTITNLNRQSRSQWLGLVVFLWEKRLETRLGWKEFPYILVDPLSGESLATPRGGAALCLL